MVQYDISTIYSTLSTQNMSVNKKGAKIIKTSN